MALASRSSSKIIITIDGPAGAGKSTVARELARQLHFSYLDTGAMYRALTLKGLRKQVDLENEENLVELARQTTIDIQGDGEKPLRVFLDGQDVSRDIRTQEVTNKTFYVARAPKVREIMVQWQRQIAEKRDVVVEGRDTGTVVFPRASCKFYLDADFKERTRRRFEELEEKGQTIEKEKLQKELRERDNKDLTREVGPLKKADDAVVIDTTAMSAEQVTEKLLKLIQGRLAG
jgi:cytidylate kinase